ncbi:MAG: hypothetical protein U0359_38595 [Byssovorax sp.]
MKRIALARLGAAAAGLFLVHNALAQSPPSGGGDTVNPWGAAAAEAPKEGDAKKPAPNAKPADKATPAPAAKGAPRAAGRVKATPPPRRRGRNNRPVSFDGPIAGSPGFRMLEGGVTRIFVEVSRKVDVTENKAKGRVVYHLKGAQAPTRTNRLPLLTGFFATPVDRVELIEQGDGLDLAIDVHEALEPRFAVVDTPRGMVLQVDFPRGSQGPAVQPEGDDSAGKSPGRGTSTRKIEGGVQGNDSGD